MSLVYTVLVSIKHASALASAENNILFEKRGLKLGALKTRNWTSRNRTIRHHVAGLDITEPDNAAPYSKGGQRET